MVALSAISAIEQLGSTVTRNATGDITGVSFYEGNITGKHPTFTVTDDTLAHLANLPQLTTLEFLYCRGITGEGLHHLPSSLRQLELYRCSNLRTLAGMPRNLFDLNLDGCQQVRDEEIGRIAQLTNLSRLNLVSTKISSASLVCLTQLDRLTSLCLAYTAKHINDQIASILEQLTRLQELNLACTHVGDTTVATVAQLPQLRTLALDRTEVTGKGTTILRNCAELREFSLFSTVVPETRIRSLQQALPQCEFWHDYMTDREWQSKIPTSPCSCELCKPKQK